MINKKLKIANEEVPGTSVAKGHLQACPWKVLHLSWTEEEPPTDVSLKSWESFKISASILKLDRFKVNPFSGALQSEVEIAPP